MKTPRGQWGIVIQTKLLEKNLTNPVYRYISAHKYLSLISALSPTSH